MTTEITNITCPECGHEFVGYLPDRILEGNEYFSKCQKCQVDIFFVASMSETAKAVPSDATKIKYVANLRAHTKAIKGDHC